MIEMNELMEESLIPQILENGGTVVPLTIDSKETGGMGLCNPSIWQIPKSPNYLLT